MMTFRCQKDTVLDDIFFSRKEGPVCAYRGMCGK